MMVMVSGSFGQDETDSSGGTGVVPRTDKAIRIDEPLVFEWTNVWLWGGILIATAATIATVSFAMSPKKRARWRTVPRTSMSGAPAWKQKLRYRVNYGNGQVDYVPGDTKKAAMKLIADQPDIGFKAFVQFQDPDTGEWFSTGRHTKAS